MSSRALQFRIHPGVWYLWPERRNRKVPGYFDASFLCFTLIWARRI